MAVFCIWQRVCDIIFIHMVLVFLRKPNSAKKLCMYTICRFLLRSNTQALFVKWLFAFHTKKVISCDCFRGFSVSRVLSISPVQHGNWIQQQSFYIWAPGDWAFGSLSWITWPRCSKEWNWGTSSSFNGKTSLTFESETFLNVFSTK